MLYGGVAKAVAGNYANRGDNVDGSRDGELHILDVESVARGLPPLEIWGDTMEPGARLLSAAVFPESGVIWVVGSIVVGGRVTANKLWSVTADLPYTD